MKKALLFFALAFVLVWAGCSKGPAYLKDGEEAVLWESFEDDPYWFAVGTSWNDGDCSLEASQSDEFATDGDHSLKCTFKMSGEKGATFEIEGEENWSEYKGVAADFKNATDQNLNASFVLCTGDTWFWHQSADVVIEPGVTRNVRWDFFANSFRSADTDWENTGNVKDIQKIPRVAFQFFGEKGLTGAAYIDNVRLIK